MDEQIAAAQEQGRKERLASLDENQDEPTNETKHMVVRLVFILLILVALLLAGVGLILVAVMRSISYTEECDLPGIIYYMFYVVYEMVLYGR
jgi:hypothetical protein